MNRGGTIAALARSRTAGLTLHSTDSYGFVSRSSAALVPAQQGARPRLVPAQQGKQQGNGRELRAGQVLSPSSGILGAIRGLIVCCKVEKFFWRYL